MGRPVTVHTADGERTVRVPSVDVADTVGAGDAFVAGFLTWWCDQGCDRGQAGDLELLAEAARAAVTWRRRRAAPRGPTCPTTSLGRRRPCSEHHRPDQSRRLRSSRMRSVAVSLLMVAALGLAGCGGSGAGLT